MGRGGRKLPLVLSISLRTRSYAKCSPSLDLTQCGLRALKMLQVLPPGAPSPAQCPPAVPGKAWDQHQHGLVLAGPSLAPLESTYGVHL